MIDHTHFHNFLNKCPVIAILRGLDAESAIPIGRILLDLGVKIIEVPLQSDEALVSIKKLKGFSGREAIIGAGTVLSCKQVEQVHLAGGEIVVSPNLDPDVISKTLTCNLISVPGVQTVTEAISASGLGASALKFFPGAIITPKAYSAMKVVIPPQQKSIIVGAVNEHNITEYLSTGVNAVGLGSYLYKQGHKPENVKDSFMKIKPLIEARSK